MKFATRSILISFFFIVLCQVSIAQAVEPDKPQAELTSTVNARAGELQTWREQCNDPDPDLRLAYIETAIRSEDVPIQRICIRQALESDNADIRNLGLRAAMVSVKRITFSLEMPNKLIAAYKAAGGDERKQKDVEDSQTGWLFKQLGENLSFVISKASLNEGQSVWSSLGSKSVADDYYSGTAIITGTKISWKGLIVNSSNYVCSVDVSLKTNGKLSGILNCPRVEPISISADLL